MEMSAEIGEIAAALADAQKGLGKLIASNKVEVKTKVGRDYSYTYADLGDALEACRSTLNEHGISVIQETGTGDGHGVLVQTMLAHKSGQWFRSMPLFMPVQGGAQDVGSAITYARRYQLLGMVGLAPEDDDGKAAQAARPNSKPDKPAVSLATCSPAMAEANEKRLFAIAEMEGRDPGKVWDEMIKAIAPKGPLPMTTRDLSPANAKLFETKANEWIEELRPNGDNDNDHSVAFGQPDVDTWGNDDQRDH